MKIEKKKETEGDEDWTKKYEAWEFALTGKARSHTRWQRLTAEANLPCTQHWMRSEELICTESLRKECPRDSQTAPHQRVWWREEERRTESGHKYSEAVQKLQTFLRLSTEVKETLWNRAIWDQILPYRRNIFLTMMGLLWGFERKGS